MQKPRILFMDVTCPKPYCEETLKEGGLGGSEATCVRIAEGLAKRGYRVTVAQHNRQCGYRSEAGVSYQGLGGPKALADMVVVLRQPAMMEFIYKHYRGAKRFLWMHDLNERDLAYDPDLPFVGTLQVLCVSDWHAQVTSDALTTLRPGIDNVRIRVMKNPVDDDLVPDNTPVDPFKLVFFSSPHKGLDRALHLFSRIRANDSRFTFHIANPGYYDSAVSSAPGVHVMGVLSHSDAIRAVRSAGCVFHCNAVFPETFGLVYAEAHAVGTPCLTANIGAVRELLSRDELADPSDEKAIIEKVLSWANGNRPSVALPDGLRLSSVIDRWEHILNG